MPAHFSGPGVSTRHLMPATLLGLVVAVLGVVMATVPAHGAVPAPAAARVATAGVTGDAVTVTTRDVSGYRTRCFRATVVVTPRYDASGSGTWDGRWSAVAQIEAPDGELYSRSYDGTAASRSFDFKPCSDYNPAGTYRVVISWQQFDADGVSIAEGYTFGSFRYTLKPRAISRLTVTKSPYGSTGWTFAGRLTRAGKPYARQRVQVWIRLNGSWTNFEETKRTGDRGRVSWHTRGDLRKNRYVLQLRYFGNTSTQPARSAAFRLQGR